MQHQKKREKCAFVTVQTQGHAARLDDTWWVLVWGRAGLLKKQGRKRSTWAHRPRRRGHWRDRVMDECRKKYWDVVEEIISALNCDFWQKIHIYSWPFDAGKMLTVFPTEPGVHVPFWSVQQRCPLSGYRIDSPGTDASQASACICKKGKQAVDHVTSDRKCGVWKQRNLSCVHPLHIWTGDKATLIFGCCNESADLFPLIWCCVPFGLEDSISAQRFETSCTGSIFFFFFLPAEETLDAIMTFHQSADSEISIGINETVT